MFKNFLSLAIVYLFGFVAVAHAQNTYNIKDLNVTNVTASGEIMVPDISEFMTTCYRKIKNITQVVVPGWRLQKLKCNDEVVTILWKNENGRIAWLEKALKEANIDISDISSLGDTVTSNIPFGVVHTVKTSPEYTSDELNNIIYDLHQSSGLNIVLNDKNITESGYINFNIVSKSAPLVWIELLSRFSGGFVKNIEYDSDTNNWEYSGGFYVKNVPPDDLSKYYD